MLCTIFEKSKILFISLKFAFSSVQTVYMYSYKISSTCHIPSISNVFPEIEQRLLFKMNGFVNRLLKNLTMLHIFKMPLVYVEISQVDWQLQSAGT